MSQTSYRVLLPIDGSPHAERAAAYLANCTGSFAVSAIYVVNVQSIEEQAALATETGGAPDYEERGRQATARARSLLDAARLPNSLTTLLGDPPSVIVRTAEEEEVDEIIMGSRSKDALGDVIGSVAYKVIHRAHIPVTIVPAGREGAKKRPPVDAVHRILLAMDGSEHAQRAVRFVSRLKGASVPVEVELLNVQPSFPQGYVRGMLSEEMLASYQSEGSIGALNAAAEVLKAAGKACQVRVVSGDIAEEIVRVASEHHCARVVMGTRGLNAVAGMALGSVAYKVIHLSPIPVTLVK
jgi:nucleotide-binding universal stress UspA family protein